MRFGRYEGHNNHIASSQVPQQWYSGGLVTAGMGPCVQQHRPIRLPEGPFFQQLLQARQLPLPTLHLKNQVFEQAEVVHSNLSIVLSFCRSLIPLFPDFVVLSFRCSHLSSPKFFPAKFSLKIEKFLQKWIFRPFLRGRVPKKTCYFSKKKNKYIFLSFPHPAAQFFFLSPGRQKQIEFFPQIQKFPAYLDSPTPKWGGGVGHIGLG